MAGAMLILIWASTGHTGRESWWNDEARVAVTFCVVGTIAMELLIAEQLSLYTFDGDDDTYDGQVNVPGARPRWRRTGEERAQVV